MRGHKLDIIWNEVIRGAILVVSVFNNMRESSVERGSSVGRMPDSQSREPGFESPLLPFRSLGIFFHFTTPQLYKLVPGYRQWWKCE